MKNRIDLAKHFNDLGFKVGAEIGVADGRYSEILCQKIEGLKLSCIDIWFPYGKNWRDENYQNKAFETAKERLKNYNVSLIKQESIKASFLFEDNSLDFVFIDGAHDFDHVMEDIITWTRKVKKGGIVSLHDMYRFRSGGVFEAVCSYCMANNVELNIIPRYSGGHKDDQAPCAWFIKC